MGSTIKTKLVLFIVLVILLPTGVLIMNQICTINSSSITNQAWLDMSNRVCSTFTDASQLIENVINHN